MRTLSLLGHVGFDSLPHQLVRKCTEQGFQFNLMCVGETGMGKSTLIESLFNMKLEFPPCNNELKTVELHSKTYEVTEGGIHLKLTIVETAGFGDQLDKDKSAEVIVSYVNQQFENYLKEELKVKRCLEDYDDTRIHACLYFISPTGHGLKALDVVTMRRLAERVNVIPIIAKADTACKDELVRFKSKILSELKSNNIAIYQFPTDDETVRAVNSELNKLIPYAVVGSTDFVKKENGKSIRARQYPWGIVEVENEEHCDFVKLREAVLRTNVDALRERTHRVLYENYRKERLRSMKVGDGDTGPKLLEAFAQKQKELYEELAARERTMKEEFIARVSRKEEEMKKREEALTIRGNEIREKYDEEMKKVESQINTLLEEKLKLEAKVSKKARK
uniref:Septin n=1 Tax=Syphacia muris TaxID=451379 RepID=A0A0N5AD99_9BILA